MKKLIILVFVLISLCGYSQLYNKPNNIKEMIETFSVSGSIIDKETGEHLAGVLVKVVGTDKQVYTDLEGNYNIDRLKKNDEIKISYISYKDSLISINKNCVLDIKLEQ